MYPYKRAIVSSSAFILNTFLTHHTTVCVDPTTHTDVALGAVTGGSTTSLSFMLAAAGAAATKLMKKRTASSILEAVVILKVMHDVELAVERCGSLTSRGTSRRNPTCDPDAAL